VNPARAGRRSARERILAAAVSRIAVEGIDGVRIARIAMEAGVSSSLVHYHFASREALLAEALDYSYTRAGDARTAMGELPDSSHAERLRSMIDHCLPSTPALHEDWVLWVELWLRAVRHPELRPIAEELYARLHAWFQSEIEAGVSAGEFARCDPQEVADRTLALIDGFGIRTLIGDSTVPLVRARRAVEAALAQQLGLGEQLVAPARRTADIPRSSAAAPAAHAPRDPQAGELTPSAAFAAARPVLTAPSM
jgi:AcrR family transcriptional regulator